MDIFAKCGAYTRAKEALATGFYPYFIPLEQTEGTEVVANGHRLIMIGSNNYLGLTTHPKVVAAAQDAVSQYGTSCTGSRFLNGTLELHRELERRLAEFVGKEAALVFSTGMQVNLGTISSLVGRSDVVLTDKEDHASIIDGCRLSFGEMKRYRHNDMRSLDLNLSKCDSMGGEIAPLPEIVELCATHGARLMVDDAHSVGVLGNGKGTAAHFGVTDSVDLIMGTFSKSFASLGGFIAGDEEVMHYVQHTARSLIFSASMSPPSAAAALAALEVMQDEPERIDRLMAIADKMRSAFQAMGFDTGESQTPIIPVIIGRDMDMMQMWKALFEAGIYTNAVLPPAVPPGKALLRTSYMATHTDKQLDRVLDVFEQVGRSLGVL